MDRSGGPGGRKKWVSGSGKGVGRRGGGLNLGGPAGKRGSYGGRPTGGGAGGFSGGTGRPAGSFGRRGRGGMPSGGILILLVLFLIFGGKSALTGLFQSGSGAGTGTSSLLRTGGLI